jgi:hypothetical protein
MKSIKKIGTAIASVALIATWAHAKKRAPGEDISNMIIEGENRLQVHGNIPELAWNVDAYKDVPETLRDYAILGELKSPSISQPPLTLPAKSTSQKAASPWLHDIYEPPVLTLNFKGEKDVLKPKWIFVVRDSQGKPFYELNKTGAIPETLTWNGIGNNGKTLRVGFDYTYLMTIIDQAGNPKRFAGKAFRLNNFRFTRGGRTTTMFNPDSLFTERASLKFSDVGRSNLTEVKDYLRNRWSEKIDVIAYDVDLKFALSRAKVIRDYLVNSLDFPQDRVTAQGLTTIQGDGYKHVDIITK